MVTLDSHGRSRYSAARKSHRLPVTDTERTNRARFVSVEMCLETCRTEFVASDLGIEPGVAFADVCSALTFTQPHEVFWKLYCCDSSRCRVHIDGGGPLEQSRRWPGEGASSAVGADSVQPTSTCLSISAESKDHDPSLPWDSTDDGKPWVLQYLRPRTSCRSVWEAVLLRAASPARSCFV